MAESREDDWSQDVQCLYTADSFWHKTGLRLSGRVLMSKSSTSGELNPMSVSYYKDDLRTPNLSIRITLGPPTYL